MPAGTAPRRHLIGGLLLWFATFGGAVAWAVHSFLAWGVDELVCSSGHHDVAGVPLAGVLAALVVVPAAVAVAAIAVAWVAWRRLSRATAEDHDNRSLGRAQMMASIGLSANLLFFAIIVFGGAALMVFSPCQR
jgi:hypothetical protein